MNETHSPHLFFKTPKAHETKAELLLNKCMYSAVCAVKCVYK